MRIRFDQFAKNVLCDALARVGVAQAEVEVTAAPQKIDVWYVPDPAREALRADLGVLGELAREPALFEPFHDAPGLRDVRACIRKQLTWHHEQERQAQKAREAAAKEVREAAAKEARAASSAERATAPEIPFPKLCIVSAGRPETVLRDLRFEAIATGFYEAAPGLRLLVVVLPELPRLRETLLLRLLGREQVLRDAIRDLLALPAGAWELSVALPWLVHLGIDVKAGAPGAGDDEEAIDVDIQKWFQEYQENLRHEGRLQHVARLFEKRLGRSLSDTEQASLAERLDRLGEDRVDDVLLASSPEALGAWLADPAAS